ncbi:hypothetical protein DFJ73DRAFT_766663 [Zopfochytrium polystomum]|nr:hypothetical protein DFJ73DRAFT_766663 [Zopfochytrium polystomum]
MPVGLCGHSATRVGGFMYIIGGIADIPTSLTPGNPPSFYDEIFRLNIATGIWTSDTLDPAKQPDLENAQAFTRRYNHVAWAQPDNRQILFHGGQTAPFALINDTAIVSLSPDTGKVSFVNPTWVGNSNHTRYNALRRSMARVATFATSNFTAVSLIFGGIQARSSANSLVLDHVDYDTLFVPFAGSYLEDPAVAAFRASPDSPYSVSVSSGPLPANIDNQTLAAIYGPASDHAAQPVRIGFTAAAYAFGGAFAGRAANPPALWRIDAFTPGTWRWVNVTPPDPPKGSGSWDAAALTLDEGADALGPRRGRAASWLRCCRTRTRRELEAWSSLHLDEGNLTSAGRLPDAVVQAIAVGAAAVVAVIFVAAGVAVVRWRRRRKKSRVAGAAAAPADAAGRPKNAAQMPGPAAGPVVGRSQGSIWWQPGLNEEGPPKQTEALAVFATATAGASFKERSPPPIPLLSQQPLTLIRNYLRAVIAKVDGVLWDLIRPLEQSCKLKILDFEKDKGKMVFWHSSTHLLGEACELHYGCHLCIGPPIEKRFYYEMGSMEQAVTQTDFAPLEAPLAGKAIKEKQPFQRLLMTKEDLLKMFKHHKYKVHIINDKIPNSTSTTSSTWRIKALAVVKNSASYFLGDAKNDSLQRIYGISFPDKKMMTEYKHFMEEAAKRDHRKIGIEQELFFNHELSPGSWFFLPAGAHITTLSSSFDELSHLRPFSSLLGMSRLADNAWYSPIQSEYRKRGFQEVISPNMYNTKLWEISGHWQNYQENLFSFEIEKERFALKTMNCPGHCLMFAHRDRSYCALPFRMADFGVLHRNEASGALAGLTRVRRFQQGDAHIFCTVDQIRKGVVPGLFVAHLRHLRIQFLGEIATWDHAESLLQGALDKFGHPWGDGAFYGPKIDITIMDALRRRHQCALRTTFAPSSSLTIMSTASKVLHELATSPPEADR